MGNGLGRILIYGGLGLIGLGTLVVVLERVGWRLGRLPGDLVLQRGNLTVFIPITTMLLLSLVVSLLVRIWQR
ncbi:MAG: DUF2905 family protein [Bacillota bacterium]